MYTYCFLLWVLRSSTFLHTLKTGPDNFMIPLHTNVNFEINQSLMVCFSCACSHIFIEFFNFTGFDFANNVLVYTGIKSLS